LDEDSDSGFILRLNGSEAERILFARKWLYVGVRRDWRKGTAVLFLQKTESFVGSGLIAAFKRVDELEKAERDLCLEKNWSDKLYFSRLAKFEPAIPVKSTLVASRSPISLHGSELNKDIISEIEKLAVVRIIT
jgi:hypothetical protein